VTQGPKLRVISLGAGVQSTTMALMAAHGEIGPMPDCAIFADTGWEPKAVYDHLAWLTSPNVLPFPVHVVGSRDLRENAIAAVNRSNGRFASIPWFVKNPDGSDGMGRRQCTREYKLQPIERKQRELLGYRPRQRIPANSVEVWIGISLDEIFRVKPAWNAWQQNRWPLIEQRMHRNDCLQWLDRHDYPQPPKSACIGCPFHDDRYWRDMKANSPGEWADAVEMDGIIRKAFRMKGEQYMHSSRVPLAEVDLSTAEDHGQLNLFNNECEGMCGV
jgi:hypothetical protein